MEKKIKELYHKARKTIFKDKWNLISYVEGYIDGNEDNKNLLQLIGLYLNKKYEIDNVLNTWDQQIEHYNDVKGLNWGLGFQALLKEIIENNAFDFTVEDKFDEGEVIEMGAQLQNLESEEIKIGSVIQLANKLEELYKLTALFDGNIKNPNWELFYPSSKDFKSIIFYNKAQENSPPVIWGSIPRIFSGFTAEIIDIRKQDDKIYLYTDLFSIDLSKALKEQEIKIIKKIEYDQKDKAVVEDLSNSIYLYRVGAYSIPALDSFEKLIARRTLELIGTSNPRDWQNYYRGSAGNWMKLKS